MKELHVLNLGVGVQSTTLYLMACRGDFRLDYAIFSDTGDEPTEVYKHLAYLQSLNGIPILVRSKGRLSADLMRGENSTSHRFASIPAFTRGPSEDDDVGRTRRQCSKEYKIEVIEKTIRQELLGLKPKQRIPKDVKVVQYIGISLDEAGRAQRMMAPRLVKAKTVPERTTKAGKIIPAKFIPTHWEKPRHLGVIRFPLIEKFMTRTNCKTWLLESGNLPHECPRSACVFCPFHDDEEWLGIKAVPEDWDLAVSVDESLRVKGNILNRNMDSEMFLHRSCLPLVQIEFKPKDKDERQASIPFWRECMGVCGI